MTATPPKSRVDDAVKVGTTTSEKPSPKARSIRERNSGRQERRRKKFSRPRHRFAGADMRPRPAAAPPRRPAAEELRPPSRAPPADEANLRSEYSAWTG